MQMHNNECMKCACMEKLHMSLHQLAWGQGFSVSDAAKKSVF